MLCVGFSLDCAIMVDALLRGLLEVITSLGYFIASVERI